MRKQILIVGAGFAGMWAALSAARLADKHQQAIDITVIAPQPELRVRPRFMKAPFIRWSHHCNRCLTLPASTSCKVTSSKSSRTLKR